MSVMEANCNDRVAVTLRTIRGERVLSRREYYRGKVRTLEKLNSTHVGGRVTPTRPPPPPPSQPTPAASHSLTRHSSVSTASACLSVFPRLLQRETEETTHLVLW